MILYGRVKCNSTHANLKQSVSLWKPATHSDIFFVQGNNAKSNPNPNLEGHTENSATGCSRQVCVRRPQIGVVYCPRMHVGLRVHPDAHMISGLLRAVGEP